MPSAANRQPPRHQPRDPALDGLRGVAILLVYLFHYGGGLKSHNPAVRAFGYLTQAGWIGVELFFALSGFLITGLLWTNLHEPHALRTFFGRRALRILPLYLGTLAAAATAALAVGVHLTELRPLLIYVAFLQNLPPLISAALHYPRPLPLNHLWSLAVEEQFYLLWPLLLLAANKSKRAVQLCLAVFVLSCVFRLVIFSPSLLSVATVARWSPFLLTRAGGLALGGALALHRLQSAPAPTWRWPWAVAVVLGLSGFLLTGFHTHSLVLNSAPQFLIGLPCIELASVALIALAQSAGLWRAMLSFGPLRLLGRVSYGFYVLHILLEPLFDHLGALLTHAAAGSAYQLVRLVLAFPITFAAAYVTFRFYETPFLRLKRFFPRRPGPLV